MKLQCILFNFWGLTLLLHCCWLLFWVCCSSCYQHGRCSTDGFIFCLVGSRFFFLVDEEEDWPWGFGFVLLGGSVGKGEALGLCVSSCGVN